VSENPDTDYPFLREWLDRQCEPDDHTDPTTAPPSPLAKDRLPDRKQETLFEGKEKQ